MRETESLNQLQAQFVSDTSPVKADLLCGVYQTEQGLPLVLPSVKLVGLLCPKFKQML